MLSKSFFVDRTGLPVSNRQEMIPTKSSDSKVEIQFYLLILVSRRGNAL